ncbi:MAG: hypothetical protein Pg6A_19660 [Termitinemataceae bacterium]|nr:MAG: hypothetical protein Pg6A_19660 [Termitinemataceae bacterium]
MQITHNKNSPNISGNDNVINYGKKVRTCESCVYRIPIEESLHPTEEHLPLGVLHNMYGKWFCDYWGLPFTKESGCTGKKACGAYKVR